MKINVINTASEVSEEKIKGKIVVVIDVLRATSVMVTALANGAKEIYPFKDALELKEAAKQNKNSVLAGERQGIKIDGFDFGNSPLEFKKELIENRNIYMSTTNGTRALEKSRNYSEEIYIGSFLNLDAVVKLLMEKNRDVAIVCSGTNDEFSLDDGLCAGMIIKKLSQELKEVEIDDTGLALSIIASDTNLSLHKILQESKHYNILKSLGFIEDLDFCLSLNSYKIVPKYIAGKIIQ